MLHLGHSVWNSECQHPVSINKAIISTTKKSWRKYYPCKHLCTYSKSSKLGLRQWITKVNLSVVDCANALGRSLVHVGMNVTNFTFLFILFMCSNPFDRISDINFSISANEDNVSRLEYRLVIRVWLSTVVLTQVQYETIRYLNKKRAQAGLEKLLISLQAS